jgi:hypothetical protein
MSRASLTQSHSQPQAANAAAKPPSAETLVRSIGGLAARLSELMIKETALLKVGRGSDVAALQLAKAELARAYSGRWVQLKAVRDEFAGLAPNLTEAFRQQLDKLTATAVENEKALRRVHRATDRVLGIIARAIREQRTATTGYTKTNLPTRRGTGALGLTLDRRF